jgi:hypothetical protein
MRKILILLFFPFVVAAQTSAPVVTAFSSLHIPGSARGLSMGDAGIASATENQQLYYNAAKTAFTQNFHQASLSYMPWFSGISNDTRFMNANYLANISNSSAMGLAINYLDLGNLAIRDDNGATLSYYHANEYNLVGTYALQLGSKISLGAAFRVIGESLYGAAPKDVFGISGDLGYYQYANVGDITRRLEWGVVVSNMGPSVNGTPLPANLGIGIGYSSVDASTSDCYTFSFDLNRLLKEDWRALRFTGGAEYGFASQFFLRGGFSYENALKGNRQYASLGVGFKGLIADQSYGLDFYYLIPFGFVGGVSPFEHGFGFTLHLSFGNFQ